MSRMMALSGIFCSFRGCFAVCVPLVSLGHQGSPRVQQESSAHGREQQHEESRRSKHLMQLLNFLVL